MLLSTIGLLLHATDNACLLSASASLVKLAHELVLAPAMHMLADIVMYTYVVLLHSCIFGALPAGASMLSTLGVQPPVLSSLFCLKQGPMFKLCGVC